METTAYYAFGVPAYCLLLAIETLAARRRGHATPSFATTIGNAQAGFGAILVGVFSGPLILGGYAWAFRRFALIHWSETGSIYWVSWIVAVLAADFAHYWHHRLEHSVAACWAIHGVHHQAEEINLTVSLRHAWFSDLYSWPFYAIAPLLGVAPAHFFVATTLISMHAFITHSREYTFPSLGIFVTPLSHTLHHATNPRYIDKNLGAMLCVWDRLFGTYVELDPTDQPVFGTVLGFETHNGVRAQWTFLRDLLRLSARARSWHDKVSVFLSRPGWIPPGIEHPPARSPRPSSEASIGRRVYIVGHMIGTGIFALYFFIHRDSFSTPMKLLFAAGILVSFLSLDNLLDDRPAAWRWEIARMTGLIAGIAGAAL